MKYFSYLHRISSAHDTGDLGKMTIVNSSRIASLTALLFVLAALVEQGGAIICYQCNSAFDPRCGDPFDPYSLGTVNCSFQPKLEHLSHLEPTLCRKISQKVYGKMRVVRGCGYVSEEKEISKCLRRSGTHDVLAMYCACTTDLCNSSRENVPARGIVIALVSMVFAFFQSLATID